MEDNAKIVMWAYRW